MKAIPYNGRWRTQTGHVPRAPGLCPASNISLCPRLPLLQTCQHFRVCAPISEHQSTWSSFSSTSASTSFPLGTEAVMLCPCVSGLRVSSLSLSRAGTSPWGWWLNNCKGHVSPSLPHPRRHMKKYFPSFVHGTVASCCPTQMYTVWAQAGIHPPQNKLSRLITITFPNLQLNQELVYRIKVKSFSCVRLFATPWTVAYQAPPSMGFSRREYWSGLPFPSLGDLPDPGIEPWSPAL